MKYVRLALVAFLLTLLQACALAQISAVPPLMNFQGKLTKPDGTPVTAGNYNLRFSVWSALTAGTEKWNQTLNPISVKNGTSGILLSGFPTGAFNGNLFLEIKVGNDVPSRPGSRWFRWRSKPSKT